jgi:poly(A) polymerase
MNLSEQITKLPFIKAASKTADELGVKVFVVGGYIRDLILNRPRNEVDFTVIGNGIEFAKALASKLKIKKVSEFKNFGTAHFKYRKFDLEFVGGRKESYNGKSRNPVVVPASFEEDIQRRDFTMNAIAVSVNKENFGEVIDIYNGIDDITLKLIRTPLDPNVTFDDDPLRILRAFRFASQLNFEVTDEIMEAAFKMRHRLLIISQERITDEFLKILSSQKPSTGLKLLYSTGVMEIIFPEISNLGGVEQRKDYHHKDVFLHTCEVVDNVSKVTENLWLRFAALVHDIAKPQTKKFVDGTGWTFHGHEELGARMMKSIFRKLKLPMHKLSYVETLVRMHLRPIALSKEEVTDSAIRRFIVDAGEYLEDLILLCRADITSKNPVKVSKFLNNYETVMAKVLEVEEKDKLRAFQSPVDGNTIMEVCNLKPGKKVGEIKAAIEDAILEGKIGNNYNEAYDYLLSIKNQFLD